ncbi:MAG: HesA/MoeB/ThiF family protein [Bacteroidia bacterium]|nr:HesA/MoeB/ThiF family protein [Bacteroidia bacterium]
MNRYSRHIVLDEIGPEGQDRLSRARVLVIGAGGLGCPALQYLAAAGVGTIGIMDFDVVEESNLQRQVLFGTSSLGKNKALAAKHRLQDLNDTIEIVAYPEALGHGNAVALFEKYDIVVDGTDTIGTRYLINDAAVLTNRPVVYGAIFKFEGQVAVFNYNSGPTYRCLFPKPPKAGSVANCSEVGVMGVLPGIIGSMQANEVLKIILGLPSVLSGTLFCLDIRSMISSRIKILRNNSEVEKVMQNANNLEALRVADDCPSTSVEVSLSALDDLEGVHFLDIREPHETPKVHLDRCLEIPMAQIEENLDQLQSLDNLVVFCQSGVRSITAVRKLKELGVEQCQSLRGGVWALVEHLKLKLS